MPLFLTEQDVADLLTMDEALVAVEEAFRLQGLGRVDNRPRQRPRLEHTLLQVMPAAVPGMGVAIEDVAVARRVYQRALASGVGQPLPQTILG